MVGGKELQLGLRIMQLIPEEETPKSRQAGKQAKVGRGKYTV